MAQKNRLPLTVYVLASVGLGLVWWMTGPRGLGLVTDSITYMQAARSVATGEGVMAYNKAAMLVPLAYHAPGMPVFLSGAWYAGMSFAAWARLWNAVFFGAGVLWTGLLVFRLTGQGRAAIVAAGLFLAVPQLLEGYGKLMSEPLFLTLWLGFLLAWISFLDGERRRDLYLAGLLAGLAAVTRYAGVAMIAASLWWLWRQRGEGQRRLDLLRFTVAAGTLPLFMLVRNMMLTGHPAGNSPGVFPLGLDRVYPLLNAFSELLLPARLPDTVRLAVLAVALAAGYRLLRLLAPVQRPAAARALRFLGLWSGVYIAALALTMLCGRGDLAFSHRILLPVYTGLIVIVASAVPALGSPWTRGKKIGAVVLALFLVLGLARSVQVAWRWHAEGYGYAARTLDESRLVEILRSLDDAVPLYASDPQAAYYFIGRPAVKVPAPGEDPGYLLPFPSLVQDFRERRGVAVMFAPKPVPAGDLWQTLRAAAGLEPLFVSEAGDIDGFRRKR